MPGFDDVYLKSSDTICNIIRLFIPYAFTNSMIETEGSPEMYLWAAPNLFFLCRGFLVCVLCQNLFLVQPYLPCHRLSIWRTLTNLHNSWLLV